MNNPTLTLSIPVNNRLLTLMSGDITRVSTDAIGNAANSALAGGGGVDGAIHRVAGPSIMDELHVIRAQIGRCQVGKAVVTSAGRLPAKWILHAVGPIYQDGNHGEPEALRSCYHCCLELATELGASKLTLPAISTGVYGYPIAQAASISLQTVFDFLESGNSTLQEVIFVLFGPKVFRSFADFAMETLTPDKSSS